MNKSRLFQNLVPLLFLIIGLITATSINSFSTNSQVEPVKFRLTWNFTIPLISEIPLLLNE